MRNENLVTRIHVTDDQGNVVGEREVVTYAGLLNQAHKEGLKRIEASITQLPTPENGMTALATAKVTMENGVFVDAGDASPDNVNVNAVPHIVRVALTRAKARALRDAVNVGVISLEELAEDFEGHVKPAGADSTKATESSDAAKPMTASQRSYLVKLLSNRGMTEDEALQHVKDELSVDDLAEVTSKTASELIKRLSAKDRRSKRVAR